MEVIATTLTLASLAKLSLGVVKSLNDLQRKYNNADRTLSITRTYCNSIHAAALKIQDWVESTSAQDPRRKADVEAINNALIPFVDLMQSLETAVSAWVEKDPTGMRKRFWKKAKFLWEEDYFKQCLLELQLQTAAVHLLLHATQLPTYDTPKTLQAIAKDVSAVRSCSRTSTISSVSSSDTSKMILEATDKMLEGYLESDEYSVRYEELPTHEGMTTDIEPQKQEPSRNWPFGKAKQMLRLFGLNLFPWETDLSMEIQESSTAEITIEVTPVADEKLRTEGYQTPQAGFSRWNSASPTETPQCQHDLRRSVSNAAYSEFRQDRIGSSPL